MSKSQPNPRHDYGAMTDAEAMAYLTADFGIEQVALWDDRNHIISAPDVLYYADAYGDLEDAILLQDWDKSLPKCAHKGLLDSGLDIFEAVNCHEIEAERCPCCDTDMWRFEIGAGNYTNTEWVDSWGNVTGEFIEFVENQDGRYWNAAKENDHAPVLCDACSHDLGYDFPRNLRDNGSVVVHYGNGEVSGFSVKGGLVRFDFMSRGGRNSNWTDLFGLPGDEGDFPAAFATGNVTEHMDAVGWAEIAEETVKDAIPSGSRSYKTRREYRNLADEWADSEETHPDLRFTYLIDNASFGNPSFWVAEEHYDELLAEIADLVERRS